MIKIKILIKVLIKILMQQLDGNLMWQFIEYDEKTCIYYTPINLCVKGGLDLYFVSASTNITDECCEYIQRIIVNDAYGDIVYESIHL